MTEIILSLFLKKISWKQRFYWWNYQIVNLTKYFSLWRNLRNFASSYLLLVRKLLNVGTWDPITEKVKRYLRIWELISRQKSKKVVQKLREMNVIIAQCGKVVKNAITLKIFPSNHISKIHEFWLIEMDAFLPLGAFYVKNGCNITWREGFELK